MAQLREKASPAVRFAFFNAALCFEPSAVYAALLHELGGGGGGAASSVVAARTKAAAGDPDAKSLLEEMLAPAAAAAGGAVGVITSGAVPNGAAAGGKRSRTPSAATHGAEGKGGGAMCVVALDEIDQLLNRQQDVLYQLFDWAAVPATRLEPWPRP
jgi:predicted NBD/HSP70 family sugar kinase